MATKGVNPFAQFKKAGKDEEAKGKGAKSEKPKMNPFKKFAVGGFVRSADGVAQKGKTKAKQIKMAGGGKC